MPVALARGLHAWLLHRLPRDVADRLHAPNQQRPLTVSNLLGGAKPDHGRVALGPGQTAALRITALEPDTERALTAALPNPGGALVLAGARLVVQDLAASPTQHPWACSASYADLVRHYAEGAPPRTLSLRFASPTLFRMEGRNVPLPLPELILASLWRKWNAFAPEPMSDTVLDYARQHVDLGRYRVRSSLLDNQNASKGSQMGFTGDVKLRLRKEDAYCQRAVRLLCAYSFWSGVGYGTTRGMGQCRLKPDTKP